MLDNWHPESWRLKKSNQLPEYQNENEVKSVLEKLKNLPPIVFEGEIERLKTKLIYAQEGKYFILQGGDCVERFIDCNEKTILNKIKILLQMSIIITYVAKKPVIKIGRIAGQYAKPRTNPYEIFNNEKIYSYKGDIINDFTPKKDLRNPDPNRMLSGYFYSAATYNYIRAITSGGFADLHYPHNWDLDFIEKTEEREKYQQLIQNVLDAVHFMESFDGVKQEILSNIEFYISHEGLLLPYEESLTRKSSISGKYYNLGAHILWIGERTRNIDMAHVEYFRGIENPIQIKIGPNISTKELIDLLNILNPKNEIGKVCLITRLGVSNVKNILPELIKIVKENKKNVIWMCDPMHGNTVNTKNNLKTRIFNNIISELIDTFNIHKEYNSILSGVHFELTGEHVTECIGGIDSIDEEKLIQNYQTYCDPRLNYNQSMEMSFVIADILKNM